MKTINHTSLAFGVVVVVAFVCLAAAETASAASAPVIEAASASNITETDATLEAKINGGGLQTTYEFHLRIRPVCNSDEMLCLKREYVLPSGVLLESSLGQNVSLETSSTGETLLSGEAHEYWVTATNAAGSTEGPHQVFRTLWGSGDTATPTAAPNIERESVPYITETDATLEAQINTEGLATSYEFLLQPPEPACLEAEPPCMMPQHEPIRLQGGQLLGSFVGQSVSVDLNSAGVTLSPGASYRYLVSATNADGTREGSWHEFEAPMDSPPSIESESVPHITPTDATLNAEINPHGLTTEYTFKLTYPICPPPPPGGVSCMAIGMIEIPLPTRTIAEAGNQPVSVSLTVSETGNTLQAGMEYQYSIEAVNSAGKGFGPVQSFTTPSESGVEPLTEPNGGTDPQAPTTIQSAPSASSAQPRWHHRRHRHHRRNKRANLSRASRAR